MDTGVRAAGRLGKAGAARAEYRKLNGIINSVLFDGRFAMQPVYLDLEVQLLEEIAQAAGLDPDTFPNYLGEVTAACLNWDTRNPYSWFDAELRAWEKEDGLQPPPFSALLCTLAYAAERMREDGNYAQNNYYQRLFEVMDITEESHQNALRHEAKVTKRFWDALNLWLTQNDFEYGRPTARRITSWEYASYPLSQALVRDGDRKLFHSMFSQFGLSPGEKLTDAEMIQYLQEWMPGPHSSNWLRKIWGTHGLKERVAAAARNELEAWDGAETSADRRSTQTTLTLVASLNGFPRQQLKLYLSVNERDGDGDLNLSLAAGAGPAAQQAFSKLTSPLWFSGMPSEGLAFLQPTQELVLAPLMLASFQLADAGSKKAFKRVARPVLPLVQLEGGRYYREMSRISLLRPHHVLCHESWVQKVRTILETHARQGFRELAHGTCAGVPEEWVLFKDVELLQIPDVIAENLQPLVPLAESAAVELSGGLRMTQSIWHTDAPPEVAASAAAGPVTLRIGKYGLDEDESLLTEIKSEDNSAAFGTAALNLSGSEDLSIKLFERTQRKPSAELTASLRNADTPSRFGLLKIPDTGYRLDASDGRSTFSAMSLAAEAPGGAQLYGMLFKGTQSAGTYGAGNDGALISQPHESDESAGAGTSYLEDPASGLAQSCVLTGVHYWKCDAFLHGDVAKHPRWMRCEHCKVAILTRNRGEASGRSTAPKKKKGGTGNTGSAMAARISVKYPPELILDVLSYLGSGSWRKLQDIASSASPSTWFPARLSQALWDLGYIDTICKPGTVREDTWLCPAPVVTFTGDDTAFISGFRSKSLLAAVTAAVERTGGMVYRQEQEDAPPAYLLLKTPFEALKAGLKTVCDAHGRHIAIQKSPALQIASHFPDAGTLLTSLPDIHIGSREGLERFDPLTGLWSRAGSAEPGNAYRTFFAGRRYFYLVPGHGMKEAPHQMVKLLAARHAGVRLHAYNSANRSFSAVAGCEPPSLLRRALIASSGLLPRRDGNLLQYFSVAPETAAAILTKLYS